MATVALGLAALATLLVLAEPPGVLDAASSFDPRMLAAVVALAAVAQALRFWRWRLLVKASIRSEPPLLADLAGFLAANLSLITHSRAKSGRSSYVRSLFGTPEGLTSSVPGFEGVVDVWLIGLAVAMGALVAGASLAFIAAGLIFASGAALVLLNGRFRQLVVRMIAAVTGGRTAERSRGFLDGLRYLVTPLPLALAIGPGLVVVFVESAAFLLVLAGLGLHADAALAGQAALVYAAGRLAGSMSMLPGGLGVTECSIVVLARVVIGIDAATALAAALLIRALFAGAATAGGLPSLLYISRLVSQGPATRLADRTTARRH